MKARKGTRLKRKQLKTNKIRRAGYTRKGRKDEISPFMRLGGQCVD